MYAFSLLEFTTLFARQWACSSTVEWDKGCTSASHSVGLCVPPMAPPTWCSWRTFQGHFTFGSNADFRSGPLCRTNRLILGPFYRPLGPFPEYWLHEDWSLLHFWKLRILLEFSGTHILIHLFKNISWAPLCARCGKQQWGCKDAPLRGIGAEGLPRLPLKRLYVPGNMMKTGLWKWHSESSPWWCVWQC